MNMSVENKKVVAALFLLVLYCQASFCQFRDIYGTVTSVTNGIEVRASWGPGERHNWLYTYSLIQGRNRYKREVTPESIEWDIITWGRLPDGTVEKYPKIQSIVKTVLKRNKLYGGIVFGFYYNGNGRIFCTQITSSKKYNLNSPVVQQGLKEALSACDTVRLPSLYIEYNKRFHKNEVKMNWIKGKKLYYGCNLWLNR